VRRFAEARKHQAEARRCARQRTYPVKSRDVGPRVNQDMKFKAEVVVKCGKRIPSLSMYMYDTSSSSSGKFGCAVGR
jgi:hypothetical protein